MACNWSEPWSPEGGPRVHRAGDMGGSHSSAAMRGQVLQRGRHPARWRPALQGVCGWPTSAGKRVLAIRSTYRVHADASQHTTAVHGDGGLHGHPQDGD